jgi:hypothetical protein
MPCPISCWVRTFNMSTSSDRILIVSLTALATCCGMSPTGRRIWLLASSGQPGTPALSDEVSEHSEAARIVGWVVFSEVRHYTDKAAWVIAFGRHFVPDQEGPYGWLEGVVAAAQTRATMSWTLHQAETILCPSLWTSNAGDGTGIYGWAVSDREMLPKSLSMVAATRLQRSLYLLNCTDAMLLGKATT